MKVKNLLEKLTKKTFINISICLIVVFSISYFAFNKNGTLSVENEIKFDNQTISDIEISDAKISKIDDYVFTSNIKAKRNSNIDYIAIDLYDTEGNLIVTLIGYVGDEIKIDETIEIESSTDKDLSNVTRVEYKVFYTE